MIVAKDVKKLKNILSQARKKIGFVPTMGALHQGHLSLLKAAKRDCDFVIASIFVNPLQFGPKEDYKKYPRKFKKDEKLLRNLEADVLFYPSTKTMHLNDASTYVEEVALSKILCGKSRPRHFLGVCTVVAKLLNIVGPDIIYFGQKDYQQAQVIKRMIRDLFFPVKVKVLPIKRERNGLAMSSRNAHLSLKERKDALCLYRALKAAKKLIISGERNPKKVINRIQNLIKAKRTSKIDYIRIVDAEELDKLNRIKGKVLIALAVYFGKTRLIDNIILNVKT